MKRLLKFEGRKLLRQKRFYICLVVMVALLFLSALTASALANAAPPLTAQVTTNGMDFMITAINSSSFILIAGIFTALTVCEDYEQKTIKNIYGKGYIGKQVYFAKLAAVGLGTTAMFLVVMLFAFLFGTMYFGLGNGLNGKCLAVLGIQYTACMANIAMTFAISAALRKNGSSIASVIVAPMLINMGLGLFDTVMKFESFTTTSFWISAFLADLSALTVSGERMLICFAASFIYILVFTIAGLYFQKKIEL